MRGSQFSYQRQIRINLPGQLRMKSGLKPQQRCESDHGSVVRAQPRLGALEFDSFPPAGFAQLAA